MMKTTEEKDAPAVENTAGVSVPDTDATVFDAENTKPPQRRGRGRPKGSTTGAKKEATKAPPKKRAESTKLDTEKLGKQIVGLHMLVAQVTGLPEAVISESEGKVLAESLDAFCAEYGLALTGKTGAAVQMFGAAAMIYAPRVMAVKFRAAKERQAAQAIQQADNQSASFDSGGANG